MERYLVCLLHQYRLDCLNQNDVMQLDEVLQLPLLQKAKQNEEKKIYLSSLSSRKIICTCGVDGVETLYNGYFTKIPAPKAEVVDTTGAGDTFAGAYLHGLEKGTPFLNNVENAVKIASRSTSFDGSLGLLMEDLKI